MKKTILSIFTISVFALILSSHAGGINSGTMVSGSPGDANQNCTQCHGGGTLDSGTDLITTDIPVTGYVGGTEYNITVTVADAAAARFGFQITAEISSNVNVGTFGNAGNGNVDIVKNAGYATHTSTNFGSSSMSWEMTWTAPVTGTGDVTFYAAGNGADGGGNNNGLDNIYTDSEVATEDVSTEIIVNSNGSSLLSIFPNPTSSSFSVNGATTSAVINLYDLKGSHVKSFFGNNINTVSDIPKGFYIVAISDEGKVAVEKLIIQ